MKTMQTTLREEVNRLENIVKRAQARLECAPKGHLRICDRKKRVEYYYKEAGQEETGQEEAGQENAGKEASGKKNTGKNGRYLKKSETGLMKAIAQRDYDQSIVKCAEAQIAAINRFLKSYEKNRPDKIYEKINERRKELISAEVLSDEAYIEQWLKAEYKGKEFFDDENEILTERGERVRSKSEKIIADKLYALGIPYRYECPIRLGGDVVVYPDFTILRVAAREEVYLEHFGRMDDMDYVAKTLFKLASYEKNGIFLGWNLYATFETGKRVLNSRALDVLLKKLFCEE